MRLGVVADDVTGANDIGGMTAARGFETVVYAHDAFSSHPPAEVCILDTDSRLDDPSRAYDKVRAATLALRRAGCSRYHKKTCSVFRGNVGAEFDAMLDALGEDSAVVVLGFPRNGRTTVDGVHYVNGVPLAASPFRHDPVHPASSSDLVAILAARTERRVALVDRTVIALGADALRNAVLRERERGGYVIVDVPDQRSLHTIAASVWDLPVLCGSSALAEYLPDHWASAGVHREIAQRALGGVLVIAGSLTPETRAQTEHLERRGVPATVVRGARLLGHLEREREVERAASDVARALQEHGFALVRSEHDPAAVRDTQRAGAERGLDHAATGRHVSAALADVAARCRSYASYGGLVVAGGDTSAAVTRALGVTRMRIGREIRPGLPAATALDGAPLELVLKSGSFGAPDFLDEAIRHLREER